MLCIYTRNGIIVTWKLQCKMAVSPNECDNRETQSSEQDRSVYAVAQIMRVFAGYK